MNKSIKQKLFSGGLWVVGGKILALFSGLAVNAFLVRLLSPDEMGVYFLIFSIVNVFMLFSLLGMERSVVRLVSESLAVEQTRRARYVVKYVLQFGFVSSITVAILLVSGIGQLLSEKIFSSILMSGLIYYAAIWLVLFTIQRLIAEAFRGLHDIRFATIFNGLIASVISAVVLGLILWRHEKADINLALSVIIAAYGINIVLAFSFLSKSIGKLSDKNTGAISRTDVMRTSWPLYFTNIVLLSLQQGHLWLLGYYSTKESVAIYGAVVRLLVLITAALSIVTLVIPPMISQLYTKKRYSEVEKVLRIAATIAGVPSGIALLLMIFFGESMLFYLYGDHYTMGYTALQVLSAAHLINVLTGAPGVLLVMASKEKVLLLCAFISGSVGMCLSILLVDSMDYLGISIGAGVGIVLHNVLMARYCQKKMSINTFMSFREVCNITLKLRYKIANNVIYGGVWKFFESCIRVIENIVCNLLNKTIIECFGDSHIKIFQLLNRDDELKSLYFRTISVRGATAFGLSNPNSTTNAFNIFTYWIGKIQEKNTLLFMMGEVDTGYLIWWLAQKKNKEPYSMMDEAISRYKDFLLKYRHTNPNIVVCSSPLPTIKDGKTLGEIANARKEVKATQYERTQMTLKFNKSLKGWADSTRIGYLDLDPYSLNESTGLVKEFLINTNRLDHHYNPEAFKNVLKKALKNRGIDIKSINKGVLF